MQFKRFPKAALLPITWLKPGVNERAGVLADASNQQSDFPTPPPACLLPAMIRDVAVSATLAVPLLHPAADIDRNLKVTMRELDPTTTQPGTSLAQ